MTNQEDVQWTHEQNKITGTYDGYSATVNIPTSAYSELQNAHGMSNDAVERMAKNTVIEMINQHFEEKDTNLHQSN